MASILLSITVTTAMTSFAQTGRSGRHCPGRPSHFVKAQRTNCCIGRAHPSRWQRIGGTAAGNANNDFPALITPAGAFRKNQTRDRTGVIARADFAKIASDWSRLTYGILQQLSPEDPVKKRTRVAILAELLQHSPDRASYEDLLADDCVIRKDIDPCEKGLTHSKDEWLSFLFDVIKPSILDFTWGVLTSEPGWGDVDKDGWCVCSIQVSGHHTGKPLRIGGLPSLDASGAHFCFPQQQMKVKIDTATRKVTAIELVPKPGTNVVALYKALGGTIPSAMIDYERSVDDTNICVKGTAKLGPL